MNNLRKKGGRIALLSKALVKKWKSLVPGEHCSPVKKSSPLNTLKSDFKTEKTNVAKSPQKLSQSCRNEDAKMRQKEKPMNGSNIQENKAAKNQKVIN